MATELSVGREDTVRIADDVELQLRGKIDLVLAQKRRGWLRRTKDLDCRLQNRFDQGTEDLRSARQSGQRHNRCSSVFTR
jgi:hypothetical protein